ncbi:putative nitrogen fixation protein NifT [Plasticicumulans acidivorans]|uniref:Nitrogen fixation protein NifT n=1 Tax=Plasticicumulans acidivorans TaxID=886464 RepID=A0A317MQY2_9GAMM|nr:putative nitrogen fixation protein NifT [Plasticicumulans acidivorans]PWV59007.1 nitrogen fixation protein NifT [Plasticicumulans acidivorans]
MANVMIRRGADGGLVFYLAKKDLEEQIESLEFDQPDRWGGELKLHDGQVWHVEPLNEAPRLPITVRARRLVGSDD